MELLTSLMNMPLNFYLEFAFLGILGNLLSRAAIIYVYGNIIKEMDNPDHRTMLNEFLFARFQSIKTNTPLILMLNDFKFLVPTLTLWTNLICLYYMLKYRSAEGIIHGTVFSDKFNIFQLVKFRNPVPNK